MNVSFVTTVFNEEKAIEGLLRSLIEQTKKPEEIIVVDAGSTDKTVNKIRECTSEVEGTRRAKRDRGDTSEVKLYVKPGLNRSQGRNFGIKKAKNGIIALSDGGCILDKNWLEEITKPFKNKKVDVVAGFYRAKAKTIFELCVAPYALIMPDQVDPQNFLPSSRSMAFRKKIWQKVSGFPEQFSDNEDYVFASEFKKRGAKIVFCQKAIVDWLPRSNLKDFFAMVYRFARGDAHAGLRCKKVATVFLRYLLFLVLAQFIARSTRTEVRYYIYMIIFLYLLWAVWKNYRYVRHPLAFLYLPLLQITADLGVMLGTFQGLIKRLKLSLVSSA